MKLRAAFGLSLLLVAALTVGTQIYANLDVVRGLSRSREGEAILRLDRSLVGVVEMLAPERGATLAVIGPRTEGDPTAPSALTVAMAKPHTATLSRIPPLREQLLGESFPERPQIAAEIENLLHLNLALNERGDALRALPVRSAEMGAAWVDGRLKMLDRFTALFQRLNQAIAEISRQVAQSSSITETAVADGQSIDGIVQALVQRADRIGDWCS